jgi:hypothetical protein
VILDSTAATRHQGDRAGCFVCGVELRGASIPVREPGAVETLWETGHANKLSKETTANSWIDWIHEATKLSDHLCRRKLLVSLT